MKDIIEGDKRDEWGVRYESVLSVLNNSSVAPHEYFTAFNNLIDGPIDADKFDYLRRDARACDVSYSGSLDFERFLKCITVLVNITNGHSALTLGVKEKGLPASEAITIARRQLYQSIYLQHTTRSLKAMVMTACAQANASMTSEVNKVLTGSGEQMPLDCARERLVHEMFVCHLIGVTPAFASLRAYSEKAVGDKRKSRKSLYDKILRGVWHDRIVNGHMYCMSNELKLDRSITFFWSFMDDSSRRLIKVYLGRVIYKRLTENSFDALGSNLRDVREALAWGRRRTILEDVTKDLKEQIRKTLVSGQGRNPSVSKDPAEALKEFDAKDVIYLVADLPMRDLGTGGSPPRVLKDISRKHGDYAEIIGAKPDVGHIWEAGMTIMT